jgi:hypothetical protein
MDVLAFLGPHNLLDLVEDFARKRPDELLHMVKRGFDVPGSYEATSAWPKAVERAELRDGTLNVRVLFEVTYANPVDQQDVGLVAENLAGHTEDLAIEAVATGLEWRSVELAPFNVFR